MRRTDDDDSHRPPDGPGTRSRGHQVRTGRALVPVARENQQNPALPSLTESNFTWKCRCLLGYLVGEEIHTLIVQLRKVRKGVPVTHWEDVDVAPLAKAHLATLWDIGDMPAWLAAVYRLVDMVIEEKFVPRRIRIPRYGSALEVE